LLPVYLTSSNYIKERFVHLFDHMICCKSNVLLENMIYREADLLSTGLYGGSKTFYSEIWKACAEMEER